MSGQDVELVDLEKLPEQLLRAWRDRNISTFKKILADGCNPDHEYNEEEKYQPILGVISRDPNLDGKQYAEAVLITKVNKDKQYLSGKCAIHHAVEIGNLPVLEALLEAKANPNALDQTGSTALHILVQQNWNQGKALYHKCLDLLLSTPSVDLNVTNRMGFTAIHQAVKKNNKEAVICLLEKGSLLDLDNRKVQGVSTREALLKQYPDLQDELPKIKETSSCCDEIDPSRLFTFLMENEEERFCTNFEKKIQDKSQKHLLKYDNGKYTFLQYACLNNLKMVVEMLLRKEVDQSYTPDHNPEVAISIAARRGFPEILQLLLEYSNTVPSVNLAAETPLHVVAKYCHKSPQHKECLRLLLEKRWDAPEKQLDVNFKDVLGNTALHYAVRYGDEEAMLEILNHGGYIGSENKRREAPLTKIPPHVLKSFLDQKIRHIGEPQERFTFDFSFLAPPRSYGTCPAEKIPLTGEKDIQETSKPEPETKPLLLMCKSQDLRPLLSHPVLTSFTFLKWQRIQTFFYANLLFYLSFCLILTGYILFGYREHPTLASSTENFISGVIEKTGYHEKSNYTKPDHYEPKQDGAVLLTIAIRLIIIAFLALLLLRETFQLAISPKTYLKNFENYVELFLVVLTGYVVVNDCSRAFGPHEQLGWLCPQFCAIVILVSWMELVLLIGKHPLFSVQVEMFRTVSASFIVFLSWYILLIVAFALCFFVLFRGCSGDCSESNPFTNPGTSLFKTLVMLTGEFEAGDIPFVTYIGTSHIIFTAFVFLIAIVLLNLLNGLAVADTKLIRDNAYLYSCVARVKLIAFVEDMLLGDTTTFLRPCYTCFHHKISLKFVLLEHFAKKIVFFNSLLPRGQIHVHVDKHNIIEFVDGPKIRKNCTSSYYVDNATLRSAYDIIAELNEAQKKNDLIGPRLDSYNEKIFQLTERIAAFEKRFEAIEQSNKQIEKLLIQNLAIVSLNNANNDDR